MSRIGALAVTPTFLFRTVLVTVLYVLVTPRTDAAAGRYQSATQHTRQEVLALLDRFENYFAKDGRHNLWLAAPPSGQLVLDRHEVTYAYGPIAEFVARLREKNFAEVEMIRVPVPHSHHFHKEMDADEREVLAHVLSGQLNKQVAGDLGTSERVPRQSRGGRCGQPGQQTEWVFHRIRYRFTKGD